MSNVSWDKEDRAKAKESKRPLVSLAFDRGYVEGGGSRIHYRGVGTDALCNDIAALMAKHEQEFPDAYRSELGAEIAAIIQRYEVAAATRSPVMLTEIKELLEKYSVMPQLPLKK